MRGMDPATDEIAQRIRAALASATALRVRGGGSKDFLGSAPRGELLETRGVAGIVAYEPSELVVTVRAGTPLRELEATLANAGQHLAFEPPNFSPSADSAGNATCGGMIASGLSGPARASVGALRDHVLGVTMLNGRAELLVFGGQVMKNVAGYDLSRLMAGSMGTLGVIIEVSLKVVPFAPLEATLSFELEQSAALDALHRWNSQALPLNASCWVEDEGKPMLFVRLRGAVAAVESACKRLGGERMNQAVAASDWEACRQQRLPFFQQPGAPELSLWRISVPPTTAPLPLPQPQLIEWHGGQRWLWAVAEQGEALRSVARAAGGHASLFRAGNETQRQNGTLQALAPASWRIQQELKRQFDPAGILNPGRLYPGL